MSSKIALYYCPCDNKIKIYYHSTCITNDKTYLFTFHDDSGYFYGYYKLKFNNKVIKYFENNYMIYIETILCSKNEDCRDSNDGCDISTCYSETKQCVERTKNKTFLDVPGWRPGEKVGMGVISLKISQNHLVAQRAGGISHRVSTF